MSLFGLDIVGIAAVLHGAHSLRQARQGYFFRPWSLIGALVAGQLAITGSYEDWISGESPFFTRGALLLAAAAPVLGYTFYTQSRPVRLFVRVITFLLLSVAAMVLWSLYLPQDRAIVAGLLSAAVLFMPWSAIRRWRATARQRRDDRRRRDAEARAQQASDGEQPHEGRNRGELRELHRFVRQSSRIQQTQEKRLAALERGEHRERARLAALRKEVMDQVVLIRRDDVRRIKDGGQTVQLHPHYGFLMLEAWRVLRAELGTNARSGNSAASEHDAFYFQVVSELLDAPDFEARYLHQTPGEVAVEALNRFLRGESPLHVLKSELAALPWSPGLLAPVPVRSNLVPGLLDAWLIPYRRQQDMEWQLFCAGDHPQQDHLNDVFDEMAIDLPTREEWHQLRDEKPARFARP